MQLPHLTNDAPNCLIICLSDGGLFGATPSHSVCISLHLKTHFQKETSKTISSRSETMADNRKHESNRSQSLSIRSSPINKIRRNNATKSRPIPCCNRILTRNGQTVLENERRRFRLPAFIRSRQTHRLRLQDHGVGTLRASLDPSS